MGSYCGVVLIANSGGASAAPAGRICRRSSYSISIAIGPEHLTLSLVESGSAAEVGDPRRGHFTGCRNQHSSPLREPGLRPPRPGFSYNDRVTNGDPSNGDHDPITRYEQGAMIVLFILAAAFLALIIWLGWMIL